jgi:hypothetical protein
VHLNGNTTVIVNLDPDVRVARSFAGRLIVERVNPEASKRERSSTTVAFPCRCTVRAAAPVAITDG